MTHEMGRMTNKTTIIESGMVKLELSPWRSHVESRNGILDARDREKKSQVARIRDGLSCKLTCPRDDEDTLDLLHPGSTCLTTTCLKRKHGIAMAQVEGTMDIPTTEGITAIGEALRKTTRGRDSVIHAGMRTMMTPITPISTDTTDTGRIPIQTMSVTVDREAGVGAEVIRARRHVIPAIPVIPSS